MRREQGGELRGRASGDGANSSAYAYARRDKTHGKFEPGIEDQTDWVMEAFEEQGLTNVKRTMLPGVAHSSLAKEVWAFVDGWVAE